MQLVRAYRDADGKARQRTLTVGRLDELDAETLRRLARALLDEADRLEGVARPEQPSEPAAAEPLAQPAAAQAAAHLAGLETGPKPKEEVSSPAITPLSAPPATVQRVVFASPHGGLMLFGGPKGAMRFVNGKYETADPEEIAWLCAHPDCGRMFRVSAASQLPSR